MLTGTYDNNILLKKVTDFCLEYVINKDYKQYFNIYLTDDIMEDYKLFCEDKELLTQPCGLTILPAKSEDGMTVLISSKEERHSQVFAVIHELCHVMDMVSFAAAYCDGQLCDVKNHTYYKALELWMDFHVKLYDTVFSYVFTEMESGKSYEEALEQFRKDIPERYYPAFNENMIEMLYEGMPVSDAAHYLGEIKMCNVYDRENFYSMALKVVYFFSMDIVKLYALLFDCTTFEDFSADVERIFAYVNGHDV